jgi:hypothetical protein
MIVKASKQDIEEGLRLISVDKNRELVKYLFLEFHNGPSLLGKLSPERHEKYEASLKKVSGNRNKNYFRGSGNSNKIVEGFKSWKKCNFLEISESKEPRKGKGGGTYDYKGKLYRLNLNPFFESSNKKFTEGEKDLINFIFTFKESRETVCKYDNLIQGINIFLERISFKESYNLEPLSDTFSKMFFLEESGKQKYLDESRPTWDNAIDIFFYRILKKVQSKTVDYDRLSDNPRIKKALENPWPIDVIGDSFGEDWAKPKKSKKASSRQPSK